MVEAAPSPSFKMSQPDLRPTAGEPVIPMRDTNAHTGKSRGQLLPRGFPPCDRAPGTLWQGQCKLLDRGRFALVIAAEQLRWSPMTPPFRWRTRPSGSSPYAGVLLDAGNVSHAQC